MATYIRSNCSTCSPTLSCCTRQSNAWVESRSRAALSDPACGAAHEGSWWSSVTKDGVRAANATGTGTKTITENYEVENGECKTTTSITEALEEVDSNIGDDYSIITTYNWSGLRTLISGGGSSSDSCSGNFSANQSYNVNIPDYYHENICEGTGELIWRESVSGTCTWGGEWCPDVGTDGYTVTTTRSGETTMEDLLSDAIGKLGSATWTEWGAVSYPLPDECIYPADAPTQCSHINGPYASAGTMRPYFGIPNKAGAVETEYRIKLQIPDTRYVLAKWKEVKTPETGSPTVTDKSWEKTFAGAGQLPGMIALSDVNTLTPSEFLGGGGCGWVQDLVCPTPGLTVTDLKIICTPPSQRKDYASRSAFPSEPSEEDAGKVHLALDEMETYKWNGTEFVINSRINDWLTNLADHRFADCFRPCIQGCTDWNSSNYNPYADVDDGSCVGWE